MTPTGGMGRPTIQEGGPSRPPVLNAPLRLVLIASFACSVSFYLLLSVVPLYAASLGASRTSTGMTTAVLMASTVSAELATPRLVELLGYRRLFGTGLVLLGGPAIALVGSAPISLVFVATFVRGLGFGIVIVLGSALVATLAPRERRSEALGIYGVIFGVPGIVALPAGVWLATEVGYGAVFVAGGIASFVGIPAALSIPRGSADRQQTFGIVAALRMSALARPAAIFGGTALVAGIIFTFLPLAVEDPNLGAVALLVQAVMATVARWWAGRYGDRHGSARLLVPAVACVAVGVAALALSRDAPAVIVGMIIFGAGFGIAQNVTLAMMFDRGSRSEYGTVSAMWNLAFDAGIGIGAAGFGIVITATSYESGFAITGAIVLCGLIAAVYDRVRFRERDRGA